MLRKRTRAIQKIKDISWFWFFFPGLIAARPLRAGYSPPMLLPLFLLDTDLLTTSCIPGRKQFYNIGHIYSRQSSAVYRRLRWTLNRPFPRKLWWTYTSSHPGVFCPIERPRCVLRSFSTSGGYLMNLATPLKC